MSSQDKWNRIYGQRSTPGTPSQLLTEHAFLLPDQGSALDLACGLGANACFLSEKGLSTEAWDISDVALTRLNQQQPQIQTQIRDVESQPPAEESFDVIVVTDFLYRPICPAISAALRPGGLLFYQTFCRDKITQSGPSNPSFLLENNELLSLFSDLQVLFYEEFSRFGDLNQGQRNKASLIAAKPTA